MMPVTAINLAAMLIQETPEHTVTIEEMLVLGYLAFFLVAFIAFLLAWGRGMFRNAEEAKYYMMTLDEPDYFTPDWAKEEADDDVDEPRARMDSVAN